MANRRGAGDPPVPPHAPAPPAVRLAREELGIPLLAEAEVIERGLNPHDYNAFLANLGENPNSLARRFITNTLLDPDEVAMSHVAKYYLGLMISSSIGIDVSGVRIFIPDEPLYQSCMNERIPLTSFIALLNAGTRALDAALFSSSPPGIRPRFRIHREASREQFDPNQIKKCLSASVYIYRRSDKIFLRPNDVCPKILRTEGNPLVTRENFARNLSDVDPEVYPLKLMESWGIELLSPKLRNSLLLGFAGLRQLQFIFRTSPDGCNDEQVIRGMSHARAFYVLVRRTGFNSSSRPANFIEIVGSINQYCDTLIMAAYSPEKVRRGVNTRQLYCCPRIHTPDLPAPIFSVQNLQRVGMLTPTLEGAPVFHVNQQAPDFLAQVDIERAGLIYDGLGGGVANHIQRHAAQENYRPEPVANPAQPVVGDRDQVARDANLLQNVRARQEEEAPADDGDEASNGSDEE